ncbi:MAG: hypothetical protein OJF50_005952 [Nitrospira sp.]|jgi:hypothetical protein|nr:hypothetical protein [Nitrospira sp.]
MRSEMMEFLRFGDSSGILRKGDPYLVVSGTTPVRECRTNYGQEQYFDEYHKLRYSTSITERQRNEAIQRLAGEAKQMLGKLQLGPGPTQVDLVISASELWLLPFEAVIDDAETPLFAQSDKKFVLTRRIRGEFKETPPNWSPVPRIVFISASPTWLKALPVPHAQHEDAIRESLKPWIEPLLGYDSGGADDRKVLHILKQATPDDVRALFAQAKTDKKPFTHVHVLAHGINIKNETNQLRSQMGFALATPKKKAIDADFLVEVLKSQGTLPQVVTLAICDGASQANTVVPYQSLAQRLHLAGIPIVVGSQLPLTFDGSVLLIKEFYKHLEGADVRQALHGTRVALYKEKDRLQSHDWMSLVSYVQLPEGYAEHLEEVELKAHLASLEVAKKWADQVAKCGATAQTDFLIAKEKLLNSIAKLVSLLKARQQEKRNDSLYQENAGLVGSAYKRLAELLEVRQRRDPSVQTSEISNALDEAREAYKKGYDKNLSDHWTGVQWLSLEIIQKGVMAEAGYWHAAMQAARLDAERPDEYWAWGSVAELWLLAICTTKQDGFEQARQALATFKQRAANLKEEAFAIDSTRRQLNRYATWWTKAKGFFPQAESDLSVPAQQLMKDLDN